MPNLSPFLLRALAARYGQRGSGGVPRMLRAGSDAVVQTPTGRNPTGAGTGENEYDARPGFDSLPPTADTSPSYTTAPPSHTGGTIRFPNSSLLSARPPDDASSPSPGVGSQIGQSLMDHSPLGALIAALTGQHSSWRPPIWAAAGGIKKLIESLTGGNDNGSQALTPMPDQGVTLTDIATGQPTDMTSGDDNRVAGGGGQPVSRGGGGSLISKIFGGGVPVHALPGNAGQAVRVGGYIPNTADAAAMMAALGQLGVGQGSMQGQNLV